MMLKGRGIGRNNTSTLAADPNHRHHDDKLIGWTIHCRVKQVDDVSEAVVVSTDPNNNLHSNGGSVKSSGSDPYQQTAGTWCAASTGEYHCPCPLVVATIDPTASTNTLMAQTALLAPTNDSTIATSPSQKKFPPRGAAHSAYARHKDSAVRATTGAKNVLPPTYGRRGRSTTPVNKKQIRESSIGAQKCPAPTTATNTNTGSSCRSNTPTTRSNSTGNSSKDRRRRHRRPTPTSISHDSSFCSSEGIRCVASLEALRSPKDPYSVVVRVKQEITHEDDRSGICGSPSRHIILAADTEVEVVAASSASPLSAQATPLSAQAIAKIITSESDHLRYDKVCNDQDICNSEEMESKVDNLGFLGNLPVSVQGETSEQTEYAASCDALDDDSGGPYECTAVVVVARSLSSSENDFPERPTPLPVSPHTPTRSVFTHNSCSAFAPIDPPGKKLFRSENFALVTVAAAAMVAPCAASTTVSNSFIVDDPIKYASPGQSRRILLNPFKTIISLDGMCPPRIPSLESIGPTLPKLIAPSLTPTVPGFNLIPSRIHRHVHRVPNTPVQHTANGKILPATAMAAIVLETTAPPTRSSILVSDSENRSFRWSGNDSKSGVSHATSTKSVTFQHPVHAVIPFAVEASAVNFSRELVFAPGDVVDIVYGMHNNQTGEVVKATSDLVQVRVLLGWTHRLYLSPLMLRRRATAE